MTGKRLFAIGVIFGLASLAWFILAGSVQLRTGEVTGRLGDEVSGLWGSRSSRTLRASPGPAARSSSRAAT